ncbi:type II toxin-antitoxin system Phd/YefM family antitoxin [Xanthomonas theicola]|uniref:Antitoxin n=1 Tax=Xanthomonas theicola TaxID=56464 RepID=A0A2S6ZJL3_9XANT|nr:type II toxin-antitoxin system prevent-host-death family antitoxin [Xanthomonas theicola]PPT92386.1 type II toxin-antitoxin system prevent-host-death family antitoxin [Xanthomonas theicola]QNH25104.1 type II toxin-antitoxin system Phd/YefM family antitoxin [Xanthomonas theicola]
MEFINIHKAKTHLSKLVDKAAKGEAFVIAKSGKPLVKVVPLGELPISPKKKRLGFMIGHQHVPNLDEFNSIAHDDIEKMFNEE